MKRIIYSLMAMLLVFTGSLQAQTTKAIPEDPTVPHFVKLEVNDPEGGTFTGTADVAGFGTIDIAQGVSTDLPNATIVKVIAKPNEGWKIDRITEQLSGQEELDLGKNDIETGYESSFELTDNRTLKAYFIQIGSYSVKYDLENLKVTPEITSVKEGEPLTVTLVPNETYFLLPDHIRVTMGDPNNVLSDEVYDAETGKITIPNVTGNIEITAEAVDNRYYTVTYSEAVNFHYENKLGDELPETVSAGDPLEVLLIPEDGYVIFPDMVEVTMGGTELDVEDVYLFSEEMGIIGTITIEEVTGDVEISVEAYKVTLDNVLDDSGLDGIIIEEVPMIVLYDPLPLNLLVEEEGYHLPETIRVEKNDVLQTEGVDYTYDAETGKLVINRLDGFITIYAQAEPDEPKPDPDPEDPDDPTPTPDPEDPDDPDVPTATADISGDVVKVWAANGVLHIHTPQPATVRVVSFSGALFRLMDVPGGDVQFTLPDNLYIVTVGDEVKKIKVR